MHVFVFFYLFFFYLFFFCISVLFITGHVGVIPPQRPPASPHQGCQGLPGLDMQNCKISYNIQIYFSLYKIMHVNKVKLTQKFWSADQFLTGHRTEVYNEDKNVSTTNEIFRYRYFPFITANTLHIQTCTLYTG